MFIKYSEGRIDGIYNDKDSAKREIRKDISNDEQDGQENEVKTKEEKN